MKMIYMFLVTHYIYIDNMFRVLDHFYKKCKMYCSLMMMESIPEVAISLHYVKVKHF